MDRIQDSGSYDMGSIPVGTTPKQALPQGSACFFAVVESPSLFSVSSVRPCRLHACGHSTTKIITNSLPTTKNNIFKLFYSIFSHRGASAKAGTGSSEYKKDKKQPADADRPVVGCGRPCGRRPLQRQKQGDASRRQRIAESADHSGRSRNRCHSGSEGCFLSCRGCRRTRRFRRPGCTATEYVLSVAPTLPAPHDIRSAIPPAAVLL